MDSFTLSKIEFDRVREVLATFCSCSLGEGLARRIRPSTKPEVVERWLAQTTEMVRAVRDVGLPPFGGITDIRPSLERVKPPASATAGDFAEIASTLEGAQRVRTFLQSLGEDGALLGDLSERIGTFEGEVAAIGDVVGSDGEVMDRASPRLADLRYRIEQTSAEIREVIYSYLRNPEVARLLEHRNVALHGDRYVLPVRADNRGRLPGVVHRTSNTGATVFVEPNASVQLNNRLSDLREDERREVRRILGELGLKVFRRAKEITDTLRSLAQVDLLSAKAQYAYQFEMVCPQLTSEGGIQLDRARHPLLIDQRHRQRQAGLAEEELHPVVPIDVRLGQDFDLLVITGSNTGGKTVALKTVALLVVMAQSGMHIPARRGATLRVFRDVYIDIGDEQSLQQSLSTFGAHVKRLKYIVERAKRDSLVLLDELGAGTDPDEGGAIGQAILDELRRIGCAGMVTTHLSVLKAYAFQHERVDNASVEFDTKTLSPTYELRIGTPGESHAITVAKRLGMPRSVTGAARKYLSKQGKQFSKAIRATTQVRQSAEQARSEARQAHRAAQTSQEVYEARLADLENVRQEFIHWLASLSEMTPGREVMIESLKQTGRLVRLELNKQRAVVEVNAKQIELPLLELMPDLGQKHVREHLAAQREQAAEQARVAAQQARQAEQARKQYERQRKDNADRARQFDQWLGKIARVKVGDEVPIAVRPGKGAVRSVDLPGLRATVETSEGEKVLSIQELFPQTGPFASHLEADAKRRSAGRRGGGDGAKGAKRTRSGKDKKEDNRPMPRRSPVSGKARTSLQRVLATQPGEQVFVVPFNKRATLIRFDAEKDQAVVQSGVFEMQVPVIDLEPVAGEA